MLRKKGIKTKKGFGKFLYNLGDTITALTKLNLGKPIAGKDIYIQKVELILRKK